MDSEIAYDYSPRFRIYKNGRIERLSTETFVPPSLNPKNGVVSKDAVYSPEKNLSLRIYLPHKTIEKKNNNKLPLLIYFHGGAFIMESAFSVAYNTFVTSAVSAASCISVSVDYRLAPEHLIPATYEDSWDAIKWVYTHIEGSGPEDWVNEKADFSRVFIAGDSAGANIAHHLGIRAGTEKLHISGIVLVHPYFWSKEPIDEKETTQVSTRRYHEGLWEIASPNSEKGVDDPLINVVGSGSDISGLGCHRVLLMVAENDTMVRQGLGYVAKLEKSGWVGKVEVMETKGETHAFHIRNPDTDDARQLVQRFSEFLKDETSYLYS